MTLRLLICTVVIFATTSCQSSEGVTSRPSPSATIGETTALTPAGSKTSDPAKEVTHRGITYTVVEAAPANVRILWKDDRGEQLLHLPRAASYLESKGEKVSMVCNGGIFEPGQVPSGLLIQNGKTLRPLNSEDGSGNFFLKPNGVFWLSNHAAGITDALTFDATRKDLRAAVQSGPLLLSAGNTHPAFRAAATSRVHRNGVGVTANGRIVFAISHRKAKKLPNLWEFADFFRTRGCDHALFLDGTISQMHTGTKLRKRSKTFASIMAVVEPK